MICQSFDKMSARILRQAYTPEECCEMLELIHTYRGIECSKLKVFNSFIDYNNFNDVIFFYYLGTYLYIRQYSHVFIR
jgi:hypothetical protein